MQHTTNMHNHVDNILCMCLVCIHWQQNKQLYIMFCNNFKRRLKKHTSASNNTVKHQCMFAWRHGLALLCIFSTFDMFAHTYSTFHIRIFGSIIHISRTLHGFDAFHISHIFQIYVVYISCIRHTCTYFGCIWVILHYVDRMFQVMVHISHMSYGWTHTRYFWFCRMRSCIFRILLQFLMCKYANMQICKYANVHAHGSCIQLNTQRYKYTHL